MKSGYSDKNGSNTDVSDAFRSPVIKPFLDGTVVLLYVDELAADRKYVFYRNFAYKRLLTGDTKLNDNEIAKQEEYVETVLQARELLPVDNSTLADIDLDQLNTYIQEINRPVRIETIKADIDSALSFLERKKFIQDGKRSIMHWLIAIIQLIVRSLLQYSPVSV